MSAKLVINTGLASTPSITFTCTTHQHSLTRVKKTFAISLKSPQHFGVVRARQSLAEHQKSKASRILLLPPTRSPLRSHILATAVCDTLPKLSLAKRRRFLPSHTLSAEATQQTPIKLRSVTFPSTAAFCRWLVHLSRNALWQSRNTH